VKVYRLLSRKTYERSMFEAASKKLGLDQAVLGSLDQSWGKDGSGPARTKAEKISLAKSVNSLLKHGAYDLFRDDDHSNNELKMDDIDKIMKRNSTVVRYDKDKPAAGAQPSSFSRAVFESRDPDAPQFDDEDFWERVLPEQKNAEKLLARLEAGHATETPEAREEFMDDVSKLVELAVQVGCGVCSCA
jgi:hypothetical protein